MRKNYATLFLFLVLVTVASAQGWTELGTGSSALNADNTIYTICTDTLDNVFAGGKFTNGSDNYVAYYNGSWTNLWNGTFNGAINSICYSPVLGPFAGGQFTDVHGKYYVASELVTGSSPNPTYQWQELDSLGANGQIRTLIINDLNNLLVAGDFTNAQGLTYVAQGPGNIINAWLSYGNNHFDSASSIYSLCYDAQENVYAAGTFKDTTDVFADSLSGWMNTGLNASQAIYSVCSANGNIYAAGDFTDGNGNYYVAIYNNYMWSELINAATHDSLKANGPIRSICADSRGNIYAAGSFTNGSGKYYVAMWDGSSWSEVGTGNTPLNANNAIYTLCVDSKDNIYAAGDFTDGNSNRYVAKYAGVNTGIAVLQNSVFGINVYPNPASEVVNIAHTGRWPDAHYSIFDLIGNMMQCGTLIANHTSIDISAFAAGMYIVQVGENKTERFKIVKE